MAADAGFLEVTPEAVQAAGAAAAAA